VAEDYGGRAYPGRTTPRAMGLAGVFVVGLGVLLIIIGLSLG